MADFENAIDPSTLPKRRCAVCGGGMRAIEAGSESFSAVARYQCSDCDHQVKLIPLSDTGGWMALALVAWAVIAGMIYITGKPFDADSVMWIGIVLVALMAPFLPPFFKARNYPVVDGSEAGTASGFIGNLIFLAVLFGLILTLAAMVSLVV